MKNTIKLGIAGIGRAGHGMHLPELKGKEDMFTVSAVCDIEEDRREIMHKDFGCKTYYSFEEMVLDPDIDVIDIATRSCDHFVHAKTALEAGKIVFLEKPMSGTYAQAKKLVEIDKKLGGGRLYVRHNRRFEHKFNQVQSIIDSGILGDVYYIKRSTGGFSYRHDWQTLSQYGGGQLLNWGPHLVDQSLRFAGGDYTRMFSVTKQVCAAGDCEDVVFASMVGVNGRTVEFSINDAGAIKSPEYIVHGSRGSLVDLGDGKFKIKYLREDFERPDYVPDIKSPAGMVFAPSDPIPFIEEERDWDKGKLDQTWVCLYEAIREGKPYPIPNDQALKVMQTIEEIREQNRL